MINLAWWLSFCLADRMLETSYDLLSLTKTGRGRSLDSLYFPSLKLSHMLWGLILFSIPGSNCFKRSDLLVPFTHSFKPYSTMLYFRPSIKVVFTLAGWTVGLTLLLLELEGEAWMALITVVGWVFCVGPSWQPCRDSRSYVMLKVRMLICSFNSVICCLYTDCIQYTQ